MQKTYVDPEHSRVGAQLEDVVSLLPSCFELKLLLD